MELLAEAGNYAAFQRLYGNPAYLGWPYQGPPGSAPSVTDLYYRQAAAAAALQKPLPYRLYPTVGVPVASMPNVAGGGSPFSHLSASTSLTSLSNYYQSAAATTNNGGTSTGSSLKRSPSPPLNPGSPETRPSTRSPPVSGDDDEAIQV